MQTFGMAAPAILEEHWQLVPPEMPAVFVRDGVCREAVILLGVTFRDMRGNCSSTSPAETRVTKSDASPVIGRVLWFGLLKDQRISAVQHFGGHSSSALIFDQLCRCRVSTLRSVLAALRDGGETLCIKPLFSNYPLS